MSQRITRRDLERIRHQLSDRSWSTLEHLAAYRFSTTKQIARLHQEHHTTPISAQRQTSRLLQHLHSLGLVKHLSRRIGGQRAGASGYIWHVTEAGYRLLALQAGNHQQTRHRTNEPSSAFLEHTLAIAEVWVRINEISRTSPLIIHASESEPLCWRRHLGPHGQIEWLKPDLAVTTRLQGYEYHWWFEIDLGTENPKRIRAKTNVYLRHFHDGQQQRTRGVFPAVLWITATRQRRDQLVATLSAQQNDLPGMFTVCQIDQLPDVLLAP